MRRTWLVAAAAFFLALLSNPAAAAPAAPLLAGDVLASSAAHFPQILESLAARRAAAGEALAAEGAFDIVFSASADDRLSGFWDGGVAGVELRRNLRPLGASVYGGYRVSDGRFPTYEDVNFTNEAGEAKLGALFSLLRGRAIDDRRFALLDADLAFNEADIEVLLTRIGVQHKALLAYWRWVAAGRQLEVYEDLLTIALARQTGLEEQVRQGARARIFLTENRQNILRRQRIVAEAERELLTAANALSLYYRSEDGAPRAPSRAALPPKAATPPAPEADPDAAARALAERPELALLRTGLERAEARAALSQNDLLPSLDLKAEVSRDFGAIGPGGPSRDSTDTVVGLRFSVPLQRREAKGKLQAAEARLEALRQRRRQTEDQISVDVGNILVDLSVSRQVARLAEQEVEQALAMQRAEQQRFAGGASDFFLVNVREETAADAQVRFLLADLELQIARANFDAATVNLDRLGIE